MIRNSPPSPSEQNQHFRPEQVEERRKLIASLTLNYPDQLPVSAQKEEIARAIQNHQVVIVAGETGSGKTTQLPKICLELGRGIKGMIGHTQPRRIAARSVAGRLAEEIQTPLGEAVGYQVRFVAQVQPKTLVKLMTDGILLAEIQHDPLLLSYDTIIVDEAHERSLNIDFILGYLANLLPKRPDLKVIITSATIDSEKFAKHFGVRTSLTHAIPTVPPTKPLSKTTLTTPHHSSESPHNSWDKTETEEVISAPVMQIKGRNYPVEIRYRPLDADPEPIDQTTGVVRACREIMACGSGDILVFLSGEGEIRDTAHALQADLKQAYVPLEASEKTQFTGGVQVIPLYSRLSLAEQQRIFAPHHCRRIVLATNVAETSLTVPGIRYVVDAGTARISRYSTKTKVQRLPIEPISQASANQRSGRCGRLGPGIAIRLYSEADFLARPQYTEPEILRTSISSVILQMQAAGLGAVEKFPFVDKPDAKSVQDGIAQIEEIGAIKYINPSRNTRNFHSSNSHSSNKPRYRITKIGRRLATLPLDPRLARMLLEGQKNGCASEVLIIVAALSVQDVRERPTEKQIQADQAHARFTDPRSDFIAYINIWRYLRTLQRDGSSSSLRRTMRAEYLNFLRFREWEDVVSQLRQLAKPLHLDLRPLALPTVEQISNAGFSINSDGTSENADTADRRIRSTTYANLDASSKVQTHKTNSFEPARLANKLSSDDVAAAAVAVSRGPLACSVEAIHKSLIVGLISNLGSYDQSRQEYQGTRSTYFNIWPGSGLYKKRHDWVMAAEIVETSRLYARTVAAISPEWAEQIAGERVRRTYSEPVWSRRKGAAMVTERVMLYGLTLIADRQVLASKAGESGRILAREMFIRHALVDGDWPQAGSLKFMKENAQRLDEAREIEQRRREFGLVADEEVRFNFFADLLPNDIVSGAHFLQWWKKERTQNPDLLTYPHSLLLPLELNPNSFPDYWQQGNLTLPLSYTYAPGKHNDGITITIPLLALPHLQEKGFDWLVPGLLEELVQGTIRALPKRVRRELVPAPQTAKAILSLLPAEILAEQQFPNPKNLESTASTDFVSENLKDSSLTFQEFFTRSVSSLKQFKIDDEAWDEIEIPAYLRMHFQVVDDNGQVLAKSDDLNFLKHKLAAKTQQAITGAVHSAIAQAIRESESKTKINSKSHDANPNAPQAKSKQTDSVQIQSASTESFLTKNAQNSAHFTSSLEMERHLYESLAASQILGIDTANDLTDLPTTSLPLSVETDKAGFSLKAYPAVVENISPKNTVTSKTSVSVQLFADIASQTLAHRKGIEALVLDRTRIATSRIVTRWTGKQAIILASSPYASTDELVEDCQRAAVSALLENWQPQFPGTQSQSQSPNYSEIGNNIASQSQTQSSPKIGASTHKQNQPQPSMLSERGNIPGRPEKKPQTRLDSLSALRDLRDQMYLGVNQPGKSEDSSLGRAPLSDNMQSQDEQAGQTKQSPHLGSVSSDSRTVDSSGNSPLCPARIRLRGSFAVRDRATLAEASTWVKQRLEDEVYQLVNIVVSILDKCEKVQSAMDKYKSPALAETLTEVRQHLNRLVYPGFISKTSIKELAHMPRYLQADVVRIEKAMLNPERDLDLLNEVLAVEEYVAAAERRTKEPGTDLPTLQKVHKARWLCEELRVSLFAQNLGTPMKVSAKRIYRILSA